MPLSPLLLLTEGAAADDDAARCVSVDILTTRRSCCCCLELPPVTPLFEALVEVAVGARGVTMLPEWAPPPLHSLAVRSSPAVAYERGAATTAPLTTRLLVLPGATKEEASPDADADTPNKLPLELHAAASAASNRRVSAAQPPSPLLSVVELADTPRFSVGDGDPTLPVKKPSGAPMDSHTAPAVPPLTAAAATTPSEWNPPTPLPTLALSSAEGVG